MQPPLLANKDSYCLTTLWDYSLSFIADITSPVEHHHHCYKVVVSLDNPFECVINGQALSGLRGFIVNQTIPHACFATNSHVLVNFVEADSFWGWQLRILLADQPYLNLDSVLSPEQFSRVLPVNYHGLTDDTLIPYVNAFLESIFPITRPVSDFVIDERVQQVSAYIDQNLHDRLELQDIADMICLSPDRTRHLFAEQTGVPFSQYVLWKRIRRTLQSTLTQERNLASACLQFGFTDQPHFNRSFKRIFGLTPNNLIRYCRVLL